jgi:hypothetical protein
MPQSKRSGSMASVIRAVQRQAGLALAKLRKGIRGLESELAQLLRHEQMLAQLAGQCPEKNCCPQDKDICWWECA